VTRVKNITMRIPATARNFLPPEKIVFLFVLYEVIAYSCKFIAAVSDPEGIPGWKGLQAEIDSRLEHPPGRDCLRREA
jgi:hypothetical protein